MSSSYQALEERFRRMSAIGGALSILFWDRSVMMPSGSAGVRAEQMAVLNVMVHELQTAPEMEDLLGEAEQAGGLDEWQSANLREMRHRWKHATAVPADLVEKLTHATSTSEMAWRTARPENDFKALAGPMKEVLALVRESAGAKAESFGVSAYDALLDGYDQGRTAQEIDTIFDDLLSFLPGLIHEATAFQSAGPAIIEPEGPFDIDVQEALGRDLMGVFGFDFEKGRLDVSHHPFSGGVPGDNRITTRYDENEFSASLLALLHETGHANYESRLPDKWRGQPVGRSRGMTVHESQSLLYEMQAARSPQFVSYLAPKLRDAFNGNGPAWSAENLKRRFHKVSRSLIRVYADEATYPLHVILRYRLERAMIAGDLLVEDLPGAWNDAMADIVGITPDNDTDGCMQDVHWPSGAFGYFPTYTLGAVASAQIFAAAKAQRPALMDEIARGELGSLNSWLQNAIHSQGCRYSPAELIERATGAPLGTEAFKAHLQSRYLPE